MLVTRNWTLHRGRVFWPVMVFTAFLLVGLAWGLSRGGNSNAALWEIRPMLYLPLMYVLTSNLLRKREDYQRLYWVVMVAVLVHGVVSWIYYQTLSQADQANLESLVEHGTTLAMNTMFVLVFAAWLFRGSSQSKRILLPIMAVPVVIVYFISERRAAIVGLVAALIVLAVVLFWTHRRTFWWVVPAALLASTAYVGAFWNSTSTLGFPAQAVKSVIAPDQLSARDQSSDMYRVAESYDIVATIRSNRLLGIGFGQKFSRPITLPNISFFPFSDYMTHNSVLWVWMKAGVGGFLAMLFLFGVSIRTGASALLRVRDPDDAAITLTSLTFVLMYAIFCYVDIGWDAQNMLLLAVVLAQLDNVTRLAPTGFTGSSLMARAAPKRVPTLTG